MTRTAQEPGAANSNSEAAHQNGDSPRCVTSTFKSIPSHPLGVKPLGNAYLSCEPESRSCLGYWATFSDDTLMTVLERLDVAEILALGATCKFLYAFCYSDELWKASFLRLQLKSQSWKGSWRWTVLGKAMEIRDPIDCSNVFSDVLHRPFVCSKLDLSEFSSNIPQSSQISQLDNMDHTQFAELWTERPFILTQCIQEWPAYSQWTISKLLDEFSDHEFRAEAVDWKFATYCQYMDCNNDESPLYLFDRQFAEKMDITVGGSDKSGMYWPPECFGEDLFNVLGDKRPAHRWLIVGPERSGSTFHKDPNGTSAWNAVLQGSKYWIMFPPATEVPGVYVSKDGSEVTSPLSIAEWLLTFHEEARQTPGCVEGICKAGEILHVPSGWWHLVVNLEQGIALTQNFVPQSPKLTLLSEVLAFLKYKPDQVSGFKDIVEDPFKLFCERLGSTHQDILEKALEAAVAKNNKKRTWDAVIASDSQEEQGGGFSFGFGSEASDEDEIP